VNFSRAMLVEGGIAVLLVVIILSQSFIALELVWGRFNAPLVDVAALIAVGVSALRRLPRHGVRGDHAELRLSEDEHLSASAPWYQWVAPRWAFLCLVAAGLSLMHSPDLFESVWFILRKIVFNYVVYAVGLAALLRTCPLALIHPLLLIYTAVIAAMAVGATIPLWLHGYFTASTPLYPFVVNQKTFALSLAPYIPFLWMGRAAVSARVRRYTPWVLAYACAAVLMTFSRTAWITLAFGILSLVPDREGRLFLTHPRRMLLVLAIACASMIALPLVFGQSQMNDAFNARTSLQLRAWTMFSAHPVFGYGAGMSTHYELGIAPHYRINGVDAHSVLEKIGAEFGLFGLVAFGGFYTSLLTGLVRRGIRGQATADPVITGAAVMGLALHVNLLFSTETFSASHWMPLALVLAYAAPRRGNADPA